MKMKDVKTRSMDTCKMLPLVPMALPTVYIPLLPVARGYTPPHCENTQVAY